MSFSSEFAKLLDGIVTLGSQHNASKLNSFLNNTRTEIYVFQRVVNSLTDLKMVRTKIKNQFISEDGFRRVLVRVRSVRKNCHCKLYAVNVVDIFQSYVICLGNTAFMLGLERKGAISPASSMSMVTKFILLCYGNVNIKLMRFGGSENRRVVSGREGRYFADLVQTLSQKTANAESYRASGHHSHTFF